MKTKQLANRAEALSANPNFRLNRILVPVDFSPCSKNAVAYAKALSDQFGAQLILMNVVVPFAPTGDLALDLAQIQLNLEQNAKAGLKRYRGAAGPRVETIVRVGSPPHAITEEAKNLNADLIVLATHGRRGLAHFALGSVAECVIRHAPCPTLVVREKEHDFIPLEPLKGNVTRVPATKAREKNRKL